MSLKEIPEIIKQFNQRQRMVVLILLLVFTSVTALGVKYLDDADCRPLIEQNKQLVSDYVQIVDILRKQVGEENKDLVFGDEGGSGNESSGQVDSVMVSTPPAESEPDRAPASSSGIEEDNKIALEQVLKIAKKHINNEQN